MCVISMCKYGYSLVSASHLPSLSGIMDMCHCAQLYTCSEEANSDPHTKKTTTFTLQAFFTVVNLVLDEKKMSRFGWVEVLFCDSHLLNYLHSSNMGMSLQLSMINFVILENIMKPLFKYQAFQTCDLFISILFTSSIKINKKEIQSQFLLIKLLLMPEMKY